MFLTGPCGPPNKPLEFTLHDCETGFSNTRYGKNFILQSSCLVSFTMVPSEIRLVQLVRSLTANQKVPGSILDLVEG